LSKYIGDRDIIAMLIAALIGITISGHNDYLLVTHLIYNNAPYGAIWTWINPMYWTQDFYKWYTLLFQVVWTIPQVIAVKKGRMNIRMFELYLATSVWFRFLTAYQEVSMSVMLPLASINPIMSISLILLRFPFKTFPPSLSDSDFQCAEGHCIAFEADRTSYLGLFHSATPVYFALIAWFIIPLYVWRKNKKGWKPGQEKKFWTKTSWFFIALFAFGFIAQILDLYFVRGYRGPLF
jgi:hypothetical protein